MSMDLTREQRLLQNLARASSAGKQSRQLEQFFEGLDSAAWLIELARVHLRLCTGVALPHGTFALALQLTEGRAYRLALVREDNIRACLVELARVVLALRGEQAVTRMQRTIEFQRLQRSMMFTSFGGLRKRGRKLGETFYVADASGEEIEALRVRSGLRLKEWAVQIGTSENTYRRRLDDGLIPPEWQDAARVLVARREDVLLAARATERPVTDVELVTAFAAVWRTYLEATQQLLPRNVLRPAIAAAETEEQKAARHAKEDAALLEFVPSAEEDLDIDVGEVDEVDRTQPENTDES